MKNKLLVSLLALMVSVALQGQMTASKKSIVQSVEKHEKSLIEISDKIWAAAEVAFEETVSAETLASYAEANGFTVERGVADIPTAFVATYGSGSPVIGILGEFDALPGLSQNTVPTKNPIEQGGAGHGCGHNMFGTASLGAAIAAKELMEQGKIKGTIKFFGCPAEEKYFGKVWMVREGVFDGVDVMLDWHPGAETKVGVQTGLALVDCIVEFEGQAAHAAADPWNGRSASDAAELYTHGINAYREHIKPTVRIHYHVQDAGKVVNVVPDYARLWVRVRDSDKAGVDPVYAHVKKMAEGAAIMANVDYKITLVSGIYEILVNRTGGAAMQKNLEALEEIQYTEEEVAFAKKIQYETYKPELGMFAKIEPMEETLPYGTGGSTDVGDVSWVVPVVRMSATVAPKGTPWHSWAVVACGGMSIGHKGMIFATKALGMTMVDLFEDTELREGVKAEFKERKGDHVYQGLIPPGPPAAVGN
ncbi:MAG: amidohydrolase [Bacteroidota bacterium]